MQRAIDETARRRAIQKTFNENKHNITPQTIFKDRDAIMSQTRQQIIKRTLKIIKIEIYPLSQQIL